MTQKIQMLEARKLTKRYSSRTVLCGIDTTVSQGAVTVVMGPSGGGKSTLVRSLSLVEPPDEGEVVLDGKPVDTSLWPWPTGIGSPWPAVSAVFQQLFLWPDKTLGMNVKLPATIRGCPLDTYRDLASCLGVLELMDRFPNQVSVGQRQRVALLRALVLQPRFLLLDEVTAALDVEQISALGQVLQRQLNDGMGILLVTHHLGFARSMMCYKNSGSFVFLEKGNLIEAGDADQFKKPKTARVRKFISTAAEIG